ncbi:MAG: hypothetical protein ACXIUB_05735 [Wenzhouxiangella sp.]
MSLDDILNPLEQCPLCGSRHRKAHSHAIPNLYSEKLAGLSGLDETALIERLENVQCDGCGLVYKANWFKPALLETLFRTAVPWHPKGWDAISGRFSPDNFFKELDFYQNALAVNDLEQTARWRRALLSIIDSIPALDNHDERSAITAAIQTGDCAAVRNREALIRSSMAEPAAFKRFAGFRSHQMWDWFQKKIVQLKAYAEVGCPLWGLLPIAASEGKRAVFLFRAEPNYWGDACRSGGRSCKAALQAQPGIEQQDWEAVKQRQFDLIGLFQYLDHLEDPLHFMVQAFQRAKACAVILDDFSQPTAIQHLTGWTPKTIRWLADKLGCRVHDDFEAIRPSGNVLYLLEKA